MFLFKGGTKSWLRVKFQYKANLHTIFWGVSHFPQLSVILLSLFNRKNDVQSRSSIVTPPAGVDIGARRAVNTLATVGSGRLRCLG